MYARQLAYYRVTPSKTKQTRYELNKNKIEFPKVEDAYLTDYFDLIGCHKQSYPLDFTEIQAFSQSLQLDLSIYEVTALKKMSEAYVVECDNKNINAIAPYVTSERKMMSSDEIKSIFAGIATVNA